MKEIMEKSLQSIEQQKLSLDDLLHGVCPARMAFVHAGRAPDHPDPLEHAKRLQYLVDREHRKTLRKYLRESVTGFISHEGDVSINDIFYEQILGTVSGFPLYAYYVSGDHDHVNPPNNATLIAKTIAYKFDVGKCALIVIHRDNLEWSFWTVHVEDGHKGAQELIQDADYVEGIVLGKAPEEGIEIECINCQFQATCEVKVKHKFAASYAYGTFTTYSNKLEELVEEYLLGLNNRDDGRNTGFLSPSEICTTKCDRRLWYKRMRTPRISSIDPKLRRVFDMGHAVHEVLQGMLHKAAPEFKSEVRAILPKTTIKGRCDGVLGEEGLEIKSISKKGFESVRGPKTDHHRQGTIYGASLDLTRMLYVYFNKSTGEVKCVYKNVDEEYADAVRERATRIEDMIDNNEIPDRVSGWGCRTCSYVTTCKPNI